MHTTTTTTRTRTGRSTVALLAFALTGMLATFATRPAQAQFTFQNVFSFYGADGTQPLAGLLQASDGNFYGTTRFGGANGAGTIFKMTPSGAYDVLHAFAGTSDGAGPYASLIQGTDGNLYGTALGGGSGGNGTVFKITPEGAFTLLHSFSSTDGNGDNTDGSMPQGRLLLASDGNFYGATVIGGVNGMGTLFKITSGGTFTLLHTFVGGTSDGANPLAGLIQANDGNLYGTTQRGGSSNAGTVYRFSLSNIETVLYAFKVGSADGAWPEGALIQATDGNLYGTTSLNGPGGHGVVFKLTLSGTESLLHGFSGGSSDGNDPVGGLVQAADGNFYGTTQFGGPANVGTVFKVTPAGTETLLYAFVGTSSDGAFPFAGLIQGSDGSLYGTTQNGDRLNDGVVFKITLGGTETILHAFPVNSGVQPGSPNSGLMLASDGNFYGTTQSGGAGNKGTVYRITPDGHQNIVYSFSGKPDGAFPFCVLVEDSSGNLYGMTNQGGANNDGAIFKIAPDGTETILHSFNGSDGAAPLCGLTVGSDGNLYGACFEGGATGHGTIFKITPLGAFTLLYSFKGGASDGAGPNVLIQATDGNFYGTTFSGGPSSVGFGSVFKITPLGVETPLHFFTNGADGSGPVGGLVQGPDGALYGASGYGANGVSTTNFGNGAVWKITTVGVLTPLYDFNGAPNDGASPQETLTLSPDGNLYGTTVIGGANNIGTVFRITPAGVETVLHSIAQSDGFSPASPLLLAPDGTFYGTTPAGGANNDGTIFALVPNPGTISSLSPSSAVVGGAAFTLTVNGAGFDTDVVVNWNGSPLPTTFVSVSQLTASVPAADIATVGAASVTVTQEGVTSNALTFTIGNPVPVISSLSPTSANAGGPAFTLVVKGSNFLNSSTVDWNGSPLSTTFVSATELKASVPASLIATAGTANVTVVNPAPGGGASASKSFTIAITTLSLTGVSLVKNSDGSYVAIVSLTNTGFQAANSAQISKSSLGSAATTTILPVSLGNIAPGATVQASLLYPSSAGTPGTKAKLVVSVAFTGGTSSGSLTVTLP